MSNATQRTVSRWVHIVCGVPIVGYVYTPFDQLHDFAWMIRYGFLPVLLLSGLWLWKGHVVKKLFAKEG
ncbi:MAG: hypothetical protein QM754_02445 [Tepidisphaeraceae bacterium]